MKEKGPVFSIVLLCSTMFLPGFILALVSLFRKDCITTIIKHPSLLFIPTFSYFTFSTNRGFCCKKCGDDNEGTWVALCPYWTIANIVLSSIGFGVFGVILFSSGSADTDLLDIPAYYANLGLIIMASIYTIVFLFVRIPCLDDLQYGVLKVKDPLVEYMKNDKKAVPR